MIVKKIKRDEQSIINTDFSLGSIIWGKLPFIKWWPGIIIPPSDCGQELAKFGYVWIFWFGDHKISEVPRKKVVKFTSKFAEMHSQVNGKIYRAAVMEAIQVVALRKSYKVQTSEQYLLWAKGGFKVPKETHIASYDIPIHVQKCLENIKKSKMSSSHGSKDGFDLDTNSDQEFTSNACVEKVKEGSLKIEDICIACRNSRAEVVANHPLFAGGLCILCKRRYLENIFSYGDDGKNICCVICAKPGPLILCDNINCPRSYCFYCIAIFLSSPILKEIVEMSSWFCFFCPHHKKHDGLLCLKDDTENRLMQLFQPKMKVQELSVLDYAVKKPLVVLSLFDGISTGKLALDALNIKIEKYYASEIDENAIAVSKFHYADSITYIGDVLTLNEEKIQSMCPIDLLIGGSPCNDLSLVNPVRKGLFDLSGTGNLFFDYFHILKMIQKCNGQRHLFYLYENVAAIGQLEKSVISSFFMKEPELFDAKFVSPQVRARYFWGNIPGMDVSSKYCWSQHNDMSSQMGFHTENLLESCLLRKLGRKATVEKIRTVTTQRGSMLQDNFTLMPVEMDGEPDVLWVTELENVFGFPMHYTDTGSININERRELLGRSWSVPVIKCILRPLQHFFHACD